MCAETAKLLETQEGDEIDRHLRRAFDDLLQQDVPDRFLELIAQLKAKEDSDNK